MTKLLNVYTDRDRHLLTYKQDKKRYSPYYKDITLDFLNDKIPYGKEVKLANFIIKNGRKYFPSRKNKYIFRNNEIPVALWLRKTIGGNVELRFDISQDDNIESADYNWNDIEWDLKEIYGHSKHSFSHALQHKNKQSHNFIIDISKSNMDNNILNINLNYIFKYKEWLNTVIIKKDNQLLGIYQKR